MRPNPFERDVPPLNHTSNLWCWIAHKGVRDPVVLLHDADRESAPLRDDAEEVVELGVVVDERHRSLRRLCAGCEGI